MKNLEHYEDEYVFIDHLIFGDELNSWVAVMNTKCLSTKLSIISVNLKLYIIYRRII